MKAGILGGTFNPVHNGHIAIACLALKRLSLDRVFLAPPSNPPHKPDTALFPFEHRLKMVELAVRNYPSLTPSRLDYTGNEKSYTKHLLQRFFRHFPQYEFYLIIGADNISQLKTWHDYQWILNNVNIVAVNRKSQEQFTDLDYANRIIFLDVPPIDVSASMIREKMINGEDISRLVPPEVDKYIKRYNLKYFLK